MPPTCWLRDNNHARHTELSLVWRGEMIAGERTSNALFIQIGDANCLETAEKKPCALTFTLLFTWVGMGIACIYIYRWCWMNPPHNSIIFIREVDEKWPRSSGIDVIWWIIFLEVRRMSHSDRLHGNNNTLNHSCGHANPGSLALVEEKTKTKQYDNSAGLVKFRCPLIEQICSNDECGSYDKFIHILSRIFSPRPDKYVYMFVYIYTILFHY